MIVTYPHMGEAYIAIKAMFDDIGVENIIPPYTTKTTLKTGAEISPETICLPFKIMLGNYINSIKAGADTIVITGSCGPCRFGYYGPVQKQILEDMGYNIDMIILDPPGEDFGSLLKSIKRLTQNSKISTVTALRNTYRVCCKLEDFQKTEFYTRPRAKDKAKFSSIIHNFKEQVVKLKGSREINLFIDETIKKLKSVETIPDFKPLKIGIIGEIYTVIEPFSNLNIEERLGNMGVEVHRATTVKDWAQNNIIYPATGRRTYKLEKKLSKPYLPVMIGGHAQQCIGHAVHYAKSGFNGIIQIYPMTCMPEIVSRSILPQVEKDYGVPILSLIVDEQTGEAGYQTRIEAFVDYIECAARATSNTKAGVQGARHPVGS